jgi:hypothetical protein
LLEDVPSDEATELLDVSEGCVSDEELTDSALLDDPFFDEELAFAAEVS